MRDARLGGTMAALLVAAGCVTVSKGMEDSELAAFKGRPIQEFLSQRIEMYGGSARTITNDLQGGLHKAVGDLQRFCVQEGGRVAVGERRAPYPKSYDATVPNFVKCASASADKTWNVQIEYRQLSAEQTRFGPILRYAVEYRLETPESIASDRLAKNIAQEKARDAVKAEDARREEWNRKFRETIKVGDRVGLRPEALALRYQLAVALVVEIRGPLAHLQFANIEPRMQWIEISRLEDPNYRPGRLSP